MQRNRDKYSQFESPFESVSLGGGGMTLIRERKTKIRFTASNKVSLMPMTQTS